MSEFQRYRATKFRKRIEIVELRAWVDGEILDGIELGGKTPSAGDMIARNVNHHAQQWLVTASVFATDYQPIA